MKAEYPYNLAMAVYGCKAEELTSEMVSKMESCLLILPLEVRDVLLLKYQNGLPDRKVAWQYGVSGSRMGQVKRKAIRLLAWHIEREGADLGGGKDY